MHVLTTENREGVRTPEQREQGVRTPGSGVTDGAVSEQMRALSKSKQARSVAAEPLLQPSSMLLCIILSESNHIIIPLWFHYVGFSIKLISQWDGNIPSIFPFSVSNTEPDIL